MSISGFLENFSLPELLRLIDLGSKSGRLILQIRSAPNNPDLIGLYHIWFRDGQLVTVIDRSQPDSLIKKIEVKGWLKEISPQKLENINMLRVPLGVYLQQEKLLTEQQLKELFSLQLEQMYELFEVPVGCFLFHEISSDLDTPRQIPWLEMTGNSIRATEVSLNALRLQQNWDVFAEQLPESHYALTQLVKQPDFKLIPIEWQVWEFANGKNSLKTIAGKINQPLLKVQKTALSLIVVGLVDEIPIVYTSSNLTRSNHRDGSSGSLVHIASDRSSLQTIAKNSTKKSNGGLSTSFLRTVVNFLRSRFGQSP